MRTRVEGRQGAGRAPVGRGRLMVGTYVHPPRRANARAQPLRPHRTAAAALALAPAAAYPATVLAPHPRPSPSPYPSVTLRKVRTYRSGAAMVVIVGAGITGLALAHELARRGAEFVVLEAAAEPGGVIRTVEVEGRLLEAGPQRARLTPQFRALVRELGLDGELVAAPPGLPLYVYRAGRLRRVPFSLGDALRTDLVSWRGKARILLEPFTAGARTGESVAEFLTRKFGREAYGAMLGPLYGGLYASDPADMPMRLTLSRALETFGIRGSILLALAGRGRRGAGDAPACSFRRGMRALTDGLHAAHRERVRLGSPARAIRRDGGRLAVATDGGEVAADDVVLTVPAGGAAVLLRGIAPDAAARLERLTYNPLAVVYLDAACDVPAMGYQVAFGEPLETRGVTFNARLFGRAGVYTAYLGGARHPAIVGWDDDRLGATAAAEFERVTGCAARPFHVERTRIPAWDRSWGALEGLALPAGVHLAANYESRAGIPGRLARARELAAALAPAGPQPPPRVP